jgi:hypothetical protein
MQGEFSDYIAGEVDGFRGEGWESRFLPLASLRGRNDKDFFWFLLDRLTQIGRAFGKLIRLRVF